MPSHDPPPPPHRIALTGASGFLGRYLLRAARKRGLEVVAVVRNPAKLDDVRGREGIHIRQADLSDKEALVRAFEGCDAVISNAALIALGTKSRAQLVAANRNGTQNVFEAIKHAGIRRAVVTSSVAAYRQQRYGHRYSESDPLWQEQDRVGHFRSYAMSKALAEAEAWRLAERFGIALSTSRPSNIYGAGDPVGIGLWLRRLMRVPALSVVPRRFCIAPVYAGDVAEAMIAMLERPQSCGRSYNLCGDDNVSMWQLYEGYRDAGGTVPRRVLPLSLPVTYRYDITAACQDLDFVNRSARDAFAETLALEVGAEPR